MSARVSFLQFLRDWLPDRGYPIARSPIRALLAGTLVTVLLSSLVLASFLAVSSPPPLLPVVQPGREAERVVLAGYVTGIAVEENGKLLWADESSGQLLSLTSDGTSPAVLLEGLHEPQGMAVDAAGNVYFTEYTRDTVSVLVPGLSTPRLVLEGLDHPTAIAVDGAGNLYFIEGPNAARIDWSGYWTDAPCGLRIVRFDHVTSTLTTLLTWTGGRGQYRGFCDIFADRSGDLYYTTGGRGTVERLHLPSLSSEVLVSGLEIARGAAVDAQGNVFIGDYRYVGVLVRGTHVPVRLSGFGCGGQVTVDGAGNVYYRDKSQRHILHVPASRVRSILGAETPTLPWPFNLLAAEAIFGLTALPAIVGAWIAYGRRNHRWYRAFEVHQTPKVRLPPDAGQEASRSTPGGTRLTRLQLILKGRVGRRHPF